MLAEPRKKIRYSNNPCGNSWANDHSGFGQQMLKRLGWSPGKGLGKNGDGIEKPIKASAKSDRRGLGKKMDYALGDCQQLEDYAKLLKSLNKSYCAVKRSSTTSLEDISESSTTRLHYSKFVRAKDTSKYDSSALRVILGGAVEEDLQEADHIHRPDSSLNPTEPSDLPDFGIKTVTSRVSMTDYFKKKLASLKANNATQEVSASETMDFERKTSALNNKDIQEGSDTSELRPKRRKHSRDRHTDPNTTSCTSLAATATDSEKSVDKCVPSILQNFNGSKALIERQNPVPSCLLPESYVNRFEKALKSSPFSETNLLSVAGYQLY
ncbi:Pin2-interacting protein X1 [Fasciola gigantica]|uniref:Pin2-interacting protein X1 n=1 Tax=Fasciola gigantica TaxID=46835 RepID=A0A504YG69_FASGI|nr:Pin2-interacting protein X1 [Fasciola gigantica]